MGIVSFSPSPIGTPSLNGTRSYGPEYAGCPNFHIMGKLCPRLLGVKSVHSFENQQFGANDARFRATLMNRR